MATPKDGGINVRLPRSLKNAIKAIADQRFTSESEIAREAIIEYLQTRNISLREEPDPYGSSSTSPTPPSTKAVSSPQPEKTDTADKVLGLVKRSYPTARKKHVHPKAPK
jgi:Arc/MetJ-type ribon-helix-helix transcriptional regulator